MNVVLPSSLTRQFLGLGLRCQHFKLELRVLQALNRGAEMLYCVLSLSDSPALALTMPRSLSETWKSLLAVTEWLHPAHVISGCWGPHEEPGLLKGSGEKDSSAWCSQRLPCPSAGEPWCIPGCWKCEEISPSACSGAHFGRPML